MVTISPALQEKIERRSRRAFSRFDEGTTPRLHRISSLGKDHLQYRIPRSGRKQVKVVRTDNGVVVDPPTTGLIDLLSKGDLKNLKNSTDKLHAGEVTAYLLVDKAKKVGKTYKKAEKFFSRAQLIERVKRDQHVYVIGFAGSDIVDVGWDHVEAGNYTVSAELDSEKDLGFTTGLLDLLTKADVEGLRKKKHLGRVRAYKYTDKDAESPVYTPKIKYVPGKDYEIKDADTVSTSNCHKGINVADVEWTKSSATGDRRVFAFEFEMEDIAAIPPSTDGKFRLHRCKCVEELDPKTFKPLKPAPRVLESNGKKTKKKGLIDRLLGRGDDEV